MECYCKKWSTKEWGDPKKVWEHVLSMTWGDLWNKHLRIMLEPSERYMFAPEAPPHLVILIEDFERKHKLTTRPLHRLEYDEMYIIYKLLLAFEQKNTMASLQLFKHAYILMLLQKYLPTDISKLIITFLST